MLFEDCAFEISVADVNDVQESREGVYTQDGSTFNGMPVYRSVSGQYLYKASASNVGWAIGPSTTQAGLRSMVKRNTNIAVLISVLIGYRFLSRRIYKLGVLF